MKKTLAIVIALAIAAAMAAVVLGVSLGDVQDALTAVEAERDQFRKQAEELDGQLAALEQSGRDAAALSDSRVLALEEELAGLQTGLEEADLLLSEKETELTESRAEAERLFVQLTEAGEQAEALDQELKNTQAKLESTREELKTARDEMEAAVLRDETVKQLQSELETKNAELAGAAAKDGERVETIAALQAQLAEQEQKLQSEADKYDGLLQQLTQTEEELAGKAALLTEAQEISENAGGKEAEARRQLDELSAQLTTAQEELSGKAALLTEAEQARDAAQQQIASMTVDQNALNQQVAAMNEANALLIDERDGLSRQNAELSAQLNTLQEELSAANGQNSSLAAELDALNGTTLELTAERDELNRQIGELNAEKDLLNTQLDALNQKIADDAETVEQAQQADSDLQEALSRVKGLETENEDLRKQLEQQDAAVREAEGLKSLADSLAAENRALSEQLAEFKALLPAPEETESGFEGTYASLVLPEADISEQDGVILFTQPSGLKGRLFAWTDENGNPVTPDQMDIDQMLEYVLSTVYGAENRPKAARLTDREGYRFSSESAFADGTPCAMEICLMRSETALYYLEIQGGGEQMDLVHALTDAVLAALTLK